MQTETQLELEDGVGDILNKARRGLKLTPEELSERADLPLSVVSDLLQGRLDTAEEATVQASLEKLSFSLNLHGPSLWNMAQGQWHPKKAEPMLGLAAFTTWYGDMTVNAYLIWDPESHQAASFDTGSSCKPMLDYISQHTLQLKRIFITHTHMDHLADLNTLQEASSAISYGSAIENPLGLKPLQHGDGLSVGKLRIRVLGTAGHTPGGLSYYIEGLSRPVVVVGDALFAGSMGGAPYAYQQALENNAQRLLSLPPETIICPGHGPLTTVLEERGHNPFFPTFK